MLAEMVVTTDFTALSVIEGFKNEQNTAAMDRCLKKLATKKGKEIFEVSQ